MIRYYLKFLGVTVSVDSDSPNLPAPIDYAGEDADLVRIARERLSSGYGAFGHPIGNSTTPIDLDAAMKKPGMREFRPQLVEGEDLVRTYNPGIPDGAIT